ncbi:MAG TPA: hypothetical protein VE825_11730 [Terriglobales bacterium]|nr:hypothetical protein [Terriglobales bacterium]
MAQLQPDHEAVHLIHGYQDGPRTGIADYQGHPHWFECIFDDEQDDYSDRYWLTPLDSAIVELAKERFEIFFRWRKAFDSGQVDLSTHPALPQEAQRHRELDDAIQEGVAARSKQRFRVRGKFIPLSGPKRVKSSSRFQVRWFAAS